MVQESLDKWELVTARVFQLLGPLQPLQRHQQAGETSRYNHRAHHSCWVQGTVTYARWQPLWEARTGWRQGQAQLSFPLLLSSRKLAKPALPVLSPSLPRGFAYAAEQAGASFVFFSSCEDMIHCSRIKFEKEFLLEGEFCLLVGIVWSNAGQNKLESLALFNS